MLRRLTDYCTPERLNWYLACLFLPQLAVFLILESTPGVLDRQERVRGRDFSTFYITGQIVRDGEASQLFDQEHFFFRQQQLVETNEKRPRNFSLYPPTIPWLFSFLARLPYGDAVVVWWLGQLGCFVLAGYLLWQVVRPSGAWRWTFLLALAAFLPVASAFWNGQLAPLLLVFVLLGLQRHSQDHPFQAGLFFSGLGLKPQLSVGPFLWMLLRGDWRALGGFCLGGLLQVGLVSAIFGPHILLDYFQGMGVFRHMMLNYLPTADHCHSFAEILINLFGVSSFRWANLVHLTLLAYAGWLLFQVIRSRRRALAWASAESEVYQQVQRVEYSAMILFSSLLTPHLLTYDLCLLLIPITYLWSGRLGVDQREQRTIGALLYLACVVTFVYAVTGFSLVPFVMVWAQYRLAGFACRSNPGSLPQSDRPAAQERALPQLAANG